MSDVNNSLHRVSAVSSKTSLDKKFKSSKEPKKSNHKLKILKKPSDFFKISSSKSDKKTKSTKFCKKRDENCQKENFTFKDLNNHFKTNSILDHNLDLQVNQNRANNLTNIQYCSIGSNQRSNKNKFDHTLIDKQDSSDEASISSTDQSLLTCSSTSSCSSSIVSGQLNCEHNLIECQSENTKTCAKQTFIQQRLRIEMEQNKLSSMMLGNNLTGFDNLDQMNKDQLKAHMNNQQNSNYHLQSNYSNLSNQMNSMHDHLQANLQGNLNYNNNTVSFNNLVNLASNFKMTNRVSAAENNNKEFNRLNYINSSNDRHKLTVQNNLVRQASFTYNPCNQNSYHHQCSNQINQQNSLERTNFNNLKTFLNRNKHLINASDDSYSDSECSNVNKFDYLNNKKCVLVSSKCSNVEILNKNLNKPMSLSQHNSPSHINYREKLCCSNRRNQHLNVYQSNQLNQQNFHNQLNQQLKQIVTPCQRKFDNCKESTISLENLTNQNDEILQINKQIDCLKNNLYWNDKKESNYLTTVQTMPSPKLKQHSSTINSFANNTITSLTNLNSTSLTDTSNSIKSSVNSSINSTNTLNSTSNTLEANYSLKLPYFEQNDELKQSSPDQCHSSCSSNELKKLRKDLLQSNQKVSLLTEKLNTNAQMVSAFEQSLHTMTNRIHQLSKSSNDKENELKKLRSLICRLLDIDELKQTEIDKLLDDLNSKVTFGEQLMTKDSNLGTPKQLMRRHTFTADEIELKLSKCKSLEIMETCNQLESLDKGCNKNKKNSDKNVLEKNRNQEIETKTSSWSKLTKAFKKSSISSKASPMHKPTNAKSIETTSDHKLNEEMIKINQLDRVDNESNFFLSTSLSPHDSFNSTNRLNERINRQAIQDNEEQKQLRKELNEKEKQLCDLRLEMLANQHQMEMLETLRFEMASIRNENERLNRLIKEKSSLISSKAEGTSESICNISIGNVSLNNDNVNTNSLSNTSSTNLAAAPSPSSILTNTTDNTSSSSSTTNKTSSTNHFEIDHLTSSNSIISSNKETYLERKHSAFNSRHSIEHYELKNLDDEIFNQKMINCSKQNLKSDDLLLKEGKLISVQLDNWDSIEQQKYTNNQKLDQKFIDSTNMLNSISSKAELGLLRITKTTSWIHLNQNLNNLINDYLNNIDKNLMAGVNLIWNYKIGDSNEIFNLVQSYQEDNQNENSSKPIDFLMNDSKLVIKLKSKSMLDHHSIQSLIPKSVLLRLLAMFTRDNRRLIISGPIGIFKTYIAHKLAEFLIQKLNSGDSDDCLSSSSSLSSELMDREKDKSNCDLIKNELKTNRIVFGSIATYHIDGQNCHNLYHYLNSLVQQYDLNNLNDNHNLPTTVLIIDNLQFIKNIDDTFSPLDQLLNTNYMPYIIATYNQGTKRDMFKNELYLSSINSTLPNLQMSNNFKWFILNHQTEPVSGMLNRFLRKKVITNLIEQQYNYLSEFNLLDIDDRHLKMHLKDQISHSLINVLSDLETKKIFSFKIIDWLDQVLRHINHFIPNNFNSIGARLFIECPINDLEQTKNWFNIKWNDLIIPYLNEINKKDQMKQIQNLKSNEDPSNWIIKSSNELNNGFNLKRLSLNESSKQSNENTNFKPLVNALNNLYQISNQ